MGLTLGFWGYRGSHPRLTDWSTIKWPAKAKKNDREINNTDYMSNSKKIGRKRLWKCLF